MKTIFNTQSSTPNTTPFLRPRLINSRAGVALSVRDEQVVYLVTEGWSDHEIARALDLNASTLKKSLLGIYEKLGVSNRVELLFCVLSLCADSRIRL